MPKKILFNIAFPIIIVGIFIMVIFAALNYENLNEQIYIVFALMAIFIFLFGFAIGQRFAKSIKKLLEKVEELSKGELKSRIYLETKDEFEELAESFNKIAEELEKSHTAVEGAKNVADVKIRAYMQESEEEINNLRQKIKNRDQEFQRIVEESERLQELVKSREAEITRLKKELQERTGKRKGVKRS
jgi:methyl-accepting chemotaxis protein